MLRVAPLATLILAPLLVSCHSAAQAARPSHDVRTELRREQDCANPKWKTDNLGLWENVCPSGSL